MTSHHVLNCSWLIWDCHFFPRGLKSVLRMRQPHTSNITNVPYCLSVTASPISWLSLPPTLQISLQWKAPSGHQPAGKWLESDPDLQSHHEHSLSWASGNDSLSLRFPKGRSLRHLPCRWLIWRCDLKKQGWRLGGVKQESRASQFRGEFLSSVGDCCGHLSHSLSLLILSSACSNLPLNPSS